LRFSVHSNASDTHGSVYVDVWRCRISGKTKVSFSGVVLNSALGAVPCRAVRTAAATSCPVDAHHRTLLRHRRHRHGLPARLSGRRREESRPVPLKVTIQDCGREVGVQQDRHAGPRQFSDEHAADYQFRLPLSALKAGEYLLTFEAPMGKATARRDVRFSVK
jgi:hypothetical protein